MSASKRRPLVFVLDDAKIIREPIAACLRNAGYETLEASDGVEGLQVIAKRIPDVMILDVGMAGMDGLTFLSKVRRRPETSRVPTIILTAAADRKTILRASELGVKQYFLKSRFSLSELLARVELCIHGIHAAKANATKPPIAPTNAEPVRTAGIDAVRPITTRDQIIERAEKALEGKTLSGVAAQVITMASAPSSNMSDLGVLIAQDPMLSANVLRVANSAAYASAKSVVTTIPDAIRKIGCATIGRIAAAIAVIDAIPDCPAGGFNPIRAWQHSFAVARICQHLTPQADQTGGVAYLAGLCHDLADILFQIHFSAECKKIADIQLATGLRRSDVEKTLIGIRRAELTATVLGKMGLPEAIRTPIIAFQNAMAAGQSPVNPSARLLLMGEMCANGILLAQSPESQVMPFLKTVCNETTGQADPENLEPEALRAEIFTLTAMLARLSPKEDARLAAPLLPRTNKKVWYARDRRFSTFDPLAAALQSMAEVQINDRLPTEAEAKECDVIVVATAESSGCGGLTEAEINAAPQTNADVRPMWLKPDADQTKPGQMPIALAELYGFIESPVAKALKVAA